MPRRVARIAAPLCALYTLALYARHLAGHVLGDTWPPLAVLNLLALYLFAPLPLLALLAAWSRRRMAWLALAPAALLFALLYGELFWPLRAPTPDHAAGVRVWTSNVRFHLSGWRLERMCDATATADPDILLFQELNGPSLRALQAALADEYPYAVRSGEEGDFLQLFLSRYPLRLEQRIRPPTGTRDTLLVAAELPQGEIVLANVHLKADAYKLLSPFDAATGPFATRRQEIEPVLAALEHEVRPVVIAGDMNTTDQTEVYRLVARRYVDSWREAGVGLGHTFPAYRLRWYGLPIPPRAVRIDYVWHSPQLRAVDIRRVNTGTSDHLALCAELAPSPAL